jgi:hypothetical protein
VTNGAKAIFYGAVVAIGLAIGHFASGFFNRDDSKPCTEQIGGHCGCAEPSCGMPCTTCCKVIPCPVTGCER